jgi:hypothetical protein
VRQLVQDAVVGRDHDARIVLGRRTTIALTISP